MTLTSSLSMYSIGVSSSAFPCATSANADLYSWCVGQFGKWNACEVLLLGSYRFGLSLASQDTTLLSRLRPDSPRTSPSRCSTVLARDSRREGAGSPTSRYITAGTLALRLAGLYLTPEPTPELKLAAPNMVECTQFSKQIIQLLLQQLDKILWQNPNK